MQPRWSSRTGLPPGCVLETAPRAGTGGGVRSLDRPGQRQSRPLLMDGRDPVCPFTRGRTLGCPPVWLLRTSVTHSRCAEVTRSKGCVGTCVVCACACVRGVSVCGVSVARVRETQARPRRWRPCFSITPSPLRNSLESCGFLTREGRGSLTLPWSRPLPHPGWSHGGRSPCPLSLRAPTVLQPSSGCPGLSPPCMAKPQQAPETSRALPPWGGAAPLEMVPQVAVTASTQMQLHLPAHVTALRDLRDLEGTRTALARRFLDSVSPPMSWAQLGLGPGQLG